MVDMPKAGIAEVDILAKVHKLVVADIVEVGWAASLVLRTTEEVEEEAWLLPITLLRMLNLDSQAPVASVGVTHPVQNLAVHMLPTSLQGLLLTKIHLPLPILEVRLVHS